MDKAKIQVIEKLPPPTLVYGVRSFLGHVRFYRRFIKDFSKITKPLCNLLMKEVSFEFNEECHHLHRSYRYEVPYDKEKSRLIRWILLLQEFDIEIKDKKGSENVVADHLSRLERDEPEISVDINEIFPDEQIFGVEKVPWYVDIFNYLAKSIPPPERGADQIVRRCIPEDEVLEILEHCHSSAYAGYFGASKTAAKILQSGFYCLLYSETHSTVALPTNDTKVVIEFLKKYIFTRYGTPRAIISDGCKHFINRQLEQPLKKYGVKHKVATPYHPQTNGFWESVSSTIGVGALSILGYETVEYGSQGYW
ncbi:uncharacterized protein LOC111398340 [Olea europaea var. sylvestris]|uniref:uncharacterized protein LOC111398340 n=1 Tax=Olea europaea var. sylvestris TaxID=158386 RepID=UPI000C1D7275|nr:uncharacterized protein LOC111398340 [Olea europaea var. sylvestris]